MIRVLIAATYNEVRDGLSTVLQLAGDIEVAGAASSLTGALQQARAAAPDVVLVDLEMAEGEGWETLRQVRRQCPGMKTIALTAHDYPAARERALQAGADCVLVKGVQVAEMLAAIRAAAG